VERGEGGGLVENVLERVRVDLSGRLDAVSPLGGNGRVLYAREIDGLAEVGVEACEACGSLGGPGRWGEASPKVRATEEMEVVVLLRFRPTDGPLNETGGSWVDGDGI
jgi:hypothetical protein